MVNMKAIYLGTPKKLWVIITLFTISTIISIFDAFYVGPEKDDAIYLVAFILDIITGATLAYGLYLRVNIIRKIAIYYLLILAVFIDLKGTFVAVGFLITLPFNWNNGYQALPYATVTIVLYMLNFWAMAYLSSAKVKDMFSDTA